MPAPRSSSPRAAMCLNWGAWSWKTPRPACWPTRACRKPTLGRSRPFTTVTNDLSFARVYFTTLDDNKRDKVIKDMNNASSFFRTELANRLDIRHIPEIKFVYDESIEYGKKIEDIIEQINKED